MVHIKGIIHCFFMQTHFIQRKQFNETNITSHAFQQISNLKIFSECFRGSLKTMCRAICGQQALVKLR